MPGRDSGSLQPPVNHYSVLGVHHQADEEEIKRAYRRLILRLHPDRRACQSSVDEAFQRVQEAYHVLRDSARRAAHDRTLVHRLDVEEYLGRFEDLLLTAQGLGMPGPVQASAPAIHHLPSVEMAQSGQMGK